MFWTKTKPDRPGWWWYRRKNSCPMVTYLDGNAELFSFGHAGSGTTEPTRIPENAEWCGPIPEPSEPPEHELVQELRTSIDALFDATHPGNLPIDVHMVKTILNAQTRTADKIQAALKSK